jgi:hypothetical protein
VADPPVRIYSTFTIKLPTFCWTFKPGLGSGANAKLEKRYSLTIQSVSSSDFDANMQGAVNLPQPVNGSLDFNQMEFTSTAQISGAKLPMNNPLPLSYKEAFPWLVEDFHPQSECALPGAQKKRAGL